MSIIRPVLRMCVIAALRQHTWAESRVYDSDNTPLVDALKKAGASPYIVVFTDDDARTNISGKDLYTTTRRLLITLEMGVASAVMVEVQKSDGVTEKDFILNIPQTDPALELLMDYLETQVINALFTNPHSKFGELVRTLVNRIERVASIRGGSAEKGTRWAARQVTFAVDVLADEAPGTMFDDFHPVKRFIVMARDPVNRKLGMAEAADFVEATLNGTVAPEWRQAQAWLALTLEGVEGMGIAPLMRHAEIPAVHTSVSFPPFDPSIINEESYEQFPPPPSEVTKPDA